MADAAAKFKSILNNPTIRDNFFPEGLQPKDYAQISATLMHGCLIWEGIRNSLDECDVQSPKT